MPLPRSAQLRPALLTVLAAAVLVAAGCGSDGSGPGYGSRDSSERQAPTARATTPAAPPGASARSCARTTVAGAEGLRVTGAGCGVGRRVVAEWAGKPSCSPAEGASRSSCAVPDDYRCLAASVEGGIAVSCSRPGSSVAFLAGRG